MQAIWRVESDKMNQCKSSAGVAVLGLEVTIFLVSNFSRRNFAADAWHILQQDTQCTVTQEAGNLNSRDPIELPKRSWSVD
jgi:hypothetical protein